MFFSACRRIGKIDMLGFFPNYLFEAAGDRLSLNGEDLDLSLRGISGRLKATPSKTISQISGKKRPACFSRRDEVSPSAFSLNEPCPSRGAGGRARSKPECIWVRGGGVALLPSVYTYLSSA
jgi:hypothetical protein